MTVRSALTLILALGLQGASASSPLQADLEFTDLKACTIDPAGLCLASWDHGDDPGVADDRIDATRILERGTVRATAPGFDPIEADLRFEDVAIAHPAFLVLEEAWLRGNSTLPPQARAVATLEAREFNGYPSNPPRGILVVIHFPSPVTNPVNGQVYPYASVPFSWDCRYYFSSYGNWDQACSQTHMRPLPHGATSHDGTDRMVQVVADWTACGFLAAQAPPACQVMDPLHAAASRLAEAWRSATPDLHFGSGIEHLTVAVVPATPPPLSLERGALGGTAGTSAGSPGTALPIRDGTLAVAADAASTWEAPLVRSKASEPTHGEPGTTAASESIALEQPLTGIAMALTALLLAAAALYHRIRRRDALEQQTRRVIHDRIMARPGILVGTLARELGLDYKTVLHHVTILASLGVIERTGDGQHPLFPKDARWGVDAKRQALAQATPVGSAVMAVLVPGQDIEIRHLAAHLEMPKSSVSTALGRLEDAGLVVRRRQGRSVFVRLVESGTPSTSPMYPVPPA